MERARRISSQRVMFVLIVIGVVGYMIRPVLLPFVLAAAVALVTTPAVEWVTARAGWRRWISAVVVFMTLLALIGALGWLVLPSLVHEVETVVTNLESILHGAISAFVGEGSVQLLGRSLTAAQMAADAIDLLRNWLTQGGRLLTLATMGSAAFFGVFLFAVVLLFFLISGPRLAHGLLSLVPPEQRPFVQHTWSRVEPVIKRYFVGLACVVGYASTAAYIGLALVLDLPGALLLALLTGFLELIPMVGPAASAVLAGLVALQSATGMWAIIGYAIYATVLRLTIDQLVGPLVLGKGDLPPPRARHLLLCRGRLSVRHRRAGPGGARGADDSDRTRRTLRGRLRPRPDRGGGARAGRGVGRCRRATAQPAPGARRSAKARTMRRPGSPEAIRRHLGDDPPSLGLIFRDDWAWLSMVQVVADQPARSGPAARPRTGDHRYAAARPGAVTGSSGAVGPGEVDGGRT
jgi:predicted PurR-regulated permease PerM